MEYFDSLPEMDLMRLEQMSSVQLIMPVESAQRAVLYLGDLGLLQFQDLNADKSPFQRTFVNQVKRCGEMSRKLQFFKDQIHKAGLMYSARPPLQQDLDLQELEAVGFLVSSNGHSAAEERELDDHVYSNGDYDDTASLLERERRPGPSNQSGLRFISGIISKAKVLSFERMLFRATRGNMLFNQAPTDEQIVDPVSTEMVEKIVFVVFFSGGQAKTKILKICEAFGANCYPVPEDITKQRQLTGEVLSRLSELEVTLDAGIHHRSNTLSSIESLLPK